MSSHRKKELLATFIVAGIGAIFAEHFLKPTVKRKLRV